MSEKKNENMKNPEEVVSKSLHNTTVNGASKNVRDLKIYGNGDSFRLLCKASSEAEGWMKSTKVLNTPTGCIMQVTTQQRNPDGTYAIAEALTYVPGCHIIIPTEDDANPYIGSIAEAKLL